MATVSISADAGARRWLRAVLWTPVFTSREEVLAIVEKAILLFREQGITGERFADTVARLGFENVQKQLLSDELLSRKEENLTAQVHLWAAPLADLLLSNCGCERSWEPV